jgi:uncharacterized DUF497 family protein
MSSTAVGGAFGYASRLARMLFVVYAELLNGDTLRIISARKASPQQRKRYTHG